MLLTVNTDLLDAPEDFAIVQCISADCAMGVTSSGKEIPCLALTLRKRYPGIVDRCGDCDPVVGDVIFYQGPDGRIILNLVTKFRYFEKPTYQSMRVALNRLEWTAVNGGITKLAIPKLGSGLDGLDWSTVSDMIYHLFYGTGIEVVLHNPKRSERSETGRA